MPPLDKEDVDPPPCVEEAPAADPPKPVESPSEVEERIQKEGRRCKYLRKRMDKDMALCEQALEKDRNWVMRKVRDVLQPNFEEMKKEQKKRRQREANEKFKTKKREAHVVDFSSDETGSEEGM